jgi:O-antigen ligase
MKKLLLELPYIKFFIKYSIPLLVIGIISRAFPVISTIYFIVPVILIINTLLASLLIPRDGKYLFYAALIFAFPVYCLLTSIWSLYSIITIQRAIYLLLLYSGILSSVLLYKILLPKKGIGFFIPANIIILILSAISLVFNIPADSWAGGNGLGFMGFAGHQNTLAAALLFTLPGIFALRAERPAHRVKGKASSILLRRWWISSYFSRLSFFILLLTTNLLLLALTYSRAALLALAVGIITYLLIIKSKKILLSIFSISVLLLVIYFTIPFMQHSIDKVLNKDGGRILDRRMLLWKPSIDAAKLGGIFGLGYGVSAPGIKTPILTGSHNEDGRYIREKGNSLFAMIEETGLIGLLLFLLPIFWILRRISMLSLAYRQAGVQCSIKEKVKNNYTLYIVNCTLLALLVHSQFEAWWVGVGSITLPLYLIFLFMILPQEKSYFIMKN